MDDQPINVRLLQHKLQREGINVISAFSGEECLSMVAEHSPDLILLDIMMPEMDGLAVCRSIKEAEATREIPIIFITAKSSREGKIAGLDAGAADYITKPIDLDETLARVNTQLRIRENHRITLDLQKRLADSRHAAAIGAVSQGIAHNLNNLLGVMVGYVDLLKITADDPTKVRKSCNAIEQAVQRMTRIVEQLSAISSNDSVNPSTMPLRVLLNGAVERFIDEYQKPRAAIRVQNPFPDLPIESNAEIFEDILGRLLINAWESYPADTDPDQRPIEIIVESGLMEGIPMLTISVLDEGCGISEELIHHVFEPFISGHTAVGRGMGLTIARHGIRSLGGDISVENRPGGGVCAKLTHPLGTDEDE